MSYDRGMKPMLMPKPTDAEIGILSVLWKRGASTVKQVHEEMGEQTGYTTILKLLQNMAEKGLVIRDESERAHVYQAKYAETDTQRQLLTGLLHNSSFRRWPPNELHGRNWRKSKN
jgi:predicted transcriptional regulator